MMAAIIDRRQMKAESRELLRDAQVSPKAMVLLYTGISLVLDLICVLGGGTALDAPFSLPGVFVNVLTSLLSLVLSVGFMLYCMAIRRGERAEFLSLFDGFSFAGKIIGLYLVEYVFIALWAMLFLIPGIIAAYRYRFAVLNLCENPDLGIFEALNMSKAQTMGYKSQLFMLDLSYVGWMILASLPMSYEGFCAGAGTEMVIPTVLYFLIVDLWSMGVALFYLASYQCTELGYFETAKQTSGVGLSQMPPRIDDGGPDLSGF